MKNLVQDGDICEVTAPYTTTSGQGVKVGAALFGVAMADIASGQKGDLRLTGIVDIAKEAPLVITAGDRVFWDDANRRVNKTAAAQLNVGVAVADALSADTIVRIRLSPVTPAGT